MGNELEQLAKKFIHTFILHIQFNKYVIPAANKCLSILDCFMSDTFFRDVKK